MRRVPASHHTVTRATARVTSSAFLSLYVTSSICDIKYRKETKRNLVKRYGESLHEDTFTKNICNLLQQSLPQFTIKLEASIIMLIHITLYIIFHHLNCGKLIKNHLRVIASVRHCGISHGEI